MYRDWCSVFLVDMTNAFPWSDCPLASAVFANDIIRGFCQRSMSSVFVTGETDLTYTKNKRLSALHRNHDCGAVVGRGLTSVTLFDRHPE